MRPARYCDRPIEITNEELCAFQEAYAVDFGKEITVVEAREIFTRLMLFCERVMNPLPNPPEVTYEATM